MNSLGLTLPDSWWRNQRFLTVMSPLVAPTLHTGTLRIAGIASNGQQFHVQPIADLVSAATLD
jgi:hypothetical protein